MEGYKVSIKEVSRDLTARERIMFKDTSNAVKLDEAIKENGSLIITVADWAVLNIHNEKADDKDYENYIIRANDGTKYVTGSPSFWSAFSEIADEMRGEDEEWAIEIYKMDSKNYKGKQFLTCSIV